GESPREKIKRASMWALFGERNRKRFAGVGRVAPRAPKTGSKKQYAAARAERRALPVTVAWQPENCFAEQSQTTPVMSSFNPFSHKFSLAVAGLILVAGSYCWS